MKSPRLLKSTAIIAGLTLVSRVMGLARDILIARFLGAGGVSDAFFTAFKLPNVFRRMFAEGAFNAAFIPLYARKIEQEGEAAADEFASEAMVALFVLVAAIVILFELTMPWTLAAIAGGLDRTVDENGVAPYALAVVYSCITMPYILFMSMMALFSGILNTRGYFAVAAAVPITLNVFMIAALALLPQFGVGQAGLAWGLSLAITLSGIVQMSIVIWACRRIGVKVGFRRPRVTPRVKRLFVLGIPGMFSAGITQINLLVSHRIATSQDSAASWLTYADRLYQLPLGMIGIAMGVALLPSLSRSIRAGNEAEAHTSLNRGLEIAAFLTLPAAVALYVIPELLIAGIYQRGAFGADTTLQVAKALKYFALGLPAFVLIKVLTPAFFAREDTRTPMIYAAISAFINIFLGLILFLKMGFSGLALATSIAAWGNVLCLSLNLLGRKHMEPDFRLLSRLPRIALASGAMGLALLYGQAYVPPIADLSFVKSLLTVVLVSAMGGLVYLFAAIALQAFHLSDIREAFSRKRG
ncbi:putative peptidoglycan lipid II flippase [Litorimonas taeanensis]|uniref:Probable lipid II flippase MurJ n=1 Tax=Litorimonas taeanensis TaxID=568099 RepID=A0A420WEU9_9PROT|nr:murein biosynthesis integral membrane protein MurJ [Litorimonas taeanensis]RKQ69510.1 putative peptidoglycan lipid II flippase [Litorimonas taeanensis]